MAVKANGYITLVRVNDGAGGTGYTVLMSNEAYAFAAGITAAVAGSTYTNVIAYKNTTQVAATVTKIGTAAVSGNASGVATGFTGLTAAVTGNGTTSCKITFSATTSLKTKNGSVAVTITVDGKSFVKDFSFSLSLKGDTGGKGEQGDPTGIIESATAPTTKYEGMLWKHTGTVSGLVNGATYRWSGTAWEMFKFRADNIEADSFEGYEFKGSIFLSDFEDYTGKLVSDNLYHKNIGSIEIGNGNIEVSYAEHTSPDNKTWTKQYMHKDTLSSLGMMFRIFTNTGTLLNETKLDASDLNFYGFGSVIQKINELNQKLPIMIFNGSKPLNGTGYWNATYNFSDFTKISMCITFLSQRHVCDFYPVSGANEKGARHSFSWNHYGNDGGKRTVAGWLTFAGRYIDQAKLSVSYNLNVWVELDLSYIIVEKIIGYR